MVEPSIEELLAPIYADLHTLTNLVFANILLTAITFLLVIILVFHIIRATREFEKTRGADLEALEHQDFFNKAQSLEISAKYIELLNLANDRLSSRPVDLHAKWFRGVSLYRMERYGESLQEFSDLREVDSAWNHDAVGAYIAEIKEKMIGPQNNAT